MQRFAKITVSKPGSVEANDPKPFSKVCVKHEPIVVNPTSRRAMNEHEGRKAIATRHRIVNMPAMNDCIVDCEWNVFTLKDPKGLAITPSHSAEYTPAQEEYHEHYKQNISEYFFHSLHTDLFVDHLNDLLLQHCRFIFDIPSLCDNILHKCFIIITGGVDPYIHERSHYCCACTKRTDTRIGDRVRITGF